MFNLLVLESFRPSHPTLPSPFLQTEIICSHFWGFIGGWELLLFLMVMYVNPVAVSFLSQLYKIGNECCVVLEKWKIQVTFHILNIYLLVVISWEERACTLMDGLQRAEYSNCQLNADFPHTPPFPSLLQCIWLSVERVTDCIFFLLKSWDEMLALLKQTNWTTLISVELRFLGTPLLSCCSLSCFQASVHLFDDSQAFVMLFDNLSSSNGISNFKIGARCLHI